MAQPNRIRKYPSLHFAETGWDTNNRRPARRSSSYEGPQSPEPFVEASAAGEFLNYSSRTIKQMARDGRIPAHPFGSSARKRWYFLISELAEHLRGQVNSAHGEAGRDKTQRRVI
jgi:helix-turn-helix protein